MEQNGNDIAASLAFATHLNDGIQMAQAPQQEAPVEQEMPQEEAQNMEELQDTTETENEAESPKEEKTDTEENKIDDLSKNFDEFKGEVKGMIESKLGDLTQTIKDALK